MTPQELNDIISMRIAVYLEGARTGLWPSLEENAAMEYMVFLYPKTSSLAYFNLLTNVVRKVHDENIPKDKYHLFNLPPQLEEEVDEYIKGNPEIIKTDIDAVSFMRDKATIPCDSCMGSVDIGQAKEDIETMIRVMAYHYLKVFELSYSCYPYFSA